MRDNTVRETICERILALPSGVWPSHIEGIIAAVRAANMRLPMTGDAIRGAMLHLVATGRVVDRQAGNIKFYDVSR